ncbi:MAG: S8 family serine peptidase, partial [Solirubrobacterales bacterium]
MRPSEPSGGATAPAARPRPRSAAIAFAFAFAFAIAGLLAPPALGAFPYNRAGGSATDYKDLFLGDETPSDLTGKLEWMYAATPEGTPGPDPFGVDLGGVRGGHIADAADGPATAWETTLGRPDVAISVLDSGIKWDDDGAMANLRFKTWLNRGELPQPNNAGTSLLGDDCGAYTGTGLGGYDRNGDAVFNLRDYSCDSRVGIAPTNNVNPDMLEPQDVLIAFSDGGDGDGNGFADDIVGWDFLDDDNDPYDDVQYGHGTGEAQDSTAEADNGGELGTCPNCVSMHMRVGDSFIADVNRFAQATIYGVDNGALVIQEALGALNNSRLSREAVAYANRHGVAVIASAADEAAQHNNWPSSLPGVILVNSVTKYDEAFTPLPRSYLQFNGCTNFNAKITVAIPSVSCSSDATGRGSGIAGLIYSAALNAHERGKLEPHPDCRRAVDVDGDPGPDPCPITSNEVRQLMASGTIGGRRTADDVDFLPLAEPNCALRLPGCTAPYQVGVLAQLTAARTVVSPLATSRAYPARGGHDQFYGYGRVNVARSVGALVPGALGDPSVKSLIPPEVEITSPQWYDRIDPSGSLQVSGRVRTRPGSGPCTYRVLVAPGHYPHAGGVPSGDFSQVGSGGCDTPVDGVLATVNVAALRARFPLGTGFDGPQPQPAPLIDNGRPFQAPNGFVVKVIASTSRGPTALTGEDQRAMWLHRDRDLLPGFPRKLMGSDATGDGESSPVLADLDGDNRNELIVGGSDGFVHAFRPDGSELPGWPVRGDRPPLHTGGRAFASGEVSADLGGAILASVAVDDLDRDGIPEVIAADLEGRVIGWRADGQRFFERGSNPDFSGKPLAPFENVRRGNTNRTQHGFLGSPVTAELDGDRAHEIVAAAMDRHVYAWNPDGSPVPGFPVLVVDPAKVDGGGGGIDPVTHRVSFEQDSGSRQQGAIIDTPAVGDLDGDADDEGDDELPEIVIGTNEEYGADDDGGLNVDSLNAALFTVLEPLGVLDPGNSRLYALKPSGDADANPNPGDAIRPGWPAKIGLAMTELLPVVGEGITGSPVIGPVGCPSGGFGPKVGAIPAAGFAYVLNAGGSSCYGRDGGRDRVLHANFGLTAGVKYDTPTLAAVGHPAFGDLGLNSPAFIAPAAGAIRALDLAVNEYQGGQDFVGAWESQTGLPHPGFPGVVNDLQFLTGPSVADIDGVGGQEVIAGTASFDLAAFSALGTPVPGWPKLTGDWTVANPTVGSFGTIDTKPGARKRVIALTRSGYVSAYETEARSCTPSSWPRFHHDNANSGDYRRDATLPGKPTDPAVVEPGGTPSLRVTAPGDELLCGFAAEWELVTSDDPIDESNFDQADDLEGAPAPASPGTVQTFAIPDGARRHLAIRAVDEQRNVGRAVSLDRGAPPPGDGDGDGVLDPDDNCPAVFNPPETPGGAQGDSDGDGIGDACD